ncbi:hypothetical protein ACJ41O_003537 [Fusarium nematophilum]
MDSLPPEILSDIASLLEDGQSFRDSQHSGVPRMHLHLTPRRLDAAEAGGYLTALRLSYVLSVNFDFIFPAHDLDVSTNADDWDDQLVFNRLVGRLFGFLARPPTRDTPLVKLSLNIPMPREAITSEWQKQVLNMSNPFAREYAKTWYMELSDNWGQHLPELPMISVFETRYSSKTLLFAPRSINRLSSKMTRLKKVCWTLCDEEMRDPELRMRQRTGAHYDTSFYIESANPEDAIGDILSQELRRLTQRDGLREFKLRASINGTLFWPAPEEPSSGSLPHWPTLQHVDVDFHSVLPSGVEVLSLVDELMLPAGRAVSCMPKIRRFWFQSPETYSTGVRFSKAVDGNEPILVVFGKAPNPSQKVLGAWRRATLVHGLEFDPVITNRCKLENGIMRLLRPQTIARGWVDWVQQM